jgi:hypothetical protein
VEPIRRRGTPHPRNAKEENIRKAIKSEDEFFKTMAGEKSRRSVPKGAAFMAEVWQSRRDVGQLFRLLSALSAVAGWKDWPTMGVHTWR